MLSPCLFTALTILIADNVQYVTPITPNLCYTSGKISSIPNPPTVVTTGSNLTSMERVSAYFFTRYSPIPVAF